MAKNKSNGSANGGQRAEDVAGESPSAVEVPAVGSRAVDGGLAIVVPIAPEVSGKYSTGRIDIELPHHAVTLRRIQDALEARGEKCRGTGSVVNFLLNLVREADEAAKARV